MKVKLITLGCPKNLVDSEVIAGGLAQSGVQFVNGKGRADAVIINTCGFIESAKEESVETILDAVALKKQGAYKQVFVTGCLSERYGDELRNEIPEIDGIYGNRNLAQIVSGIARQLRLRHELLGERALLTPKHFAYLKISEGCEHPCTFCAIPKIRGGFQSTPVPNLVDDAKRLAEKGVRELILIAQDSTNFGVDLNNEKQLPELLRQLNRVDGIEWIRLMYAYPYNMTDELIATVAGTEKVCNYIDMPIQHTSSRMLKRMARRVTADFQAELMEKMRQQIPQLVLRTSVIVGFPGETEKDFQNLYDAVSAGQFDRLGVFTYSHEENTPAARFADDVPAEVKRDRQDLLYQAQMDVSEEKNQALLRNSVTVLIDEFDSDEQVYVGRTQWDCPEIDNTVRIAEPCRVGHFYRVIIQEASAFELRGSIEQREAENHHAPRTPLHLPIAIQN